MPKDGQQVLFEDGEIAEAPSPIAAEALAIWNAIAPKAGWPEAKFLTQSRRAAMRRAIQDYGGVLGWKAHLERASTSDFLTGKSARDPRHANWRPDLDWFLKPANVVKILENKFSGVGRVSASIAPQVACGPDWRARLERYRPGKFWHDSDGPRPELPGPHKAPAELIEAWRKKHGVVERRPRQAESREDRLAAMIVSYRKVGRYLDANRIEEELAGLQGRDPVLVPAPDARDPDSMPQRLPEPAAGFVIEGDYTEVPEGDDFGMEE